MQCSNLLRKIPKPSQHKEKLTLGEIVDLGAGHCPRSVLRMRHPLQASVYRRKEGRKGKRKPLLIWRSRRGLI